MFTGPELKGKSTVNGYRSYLYACLCVSYPCFAFLSPANSGLGGFGRNKGILGFLGGALFCVPFNYRVLSIAKWATPQTRATLATASLALGLAGAFADLAVPSPVMTLPKRILGRRVPPFHIDDNFVVPIFSAFAAEKVFGALGFPLDLELAKFVWF